MILKTLQIKNFRKYKHTTIEFPEGIIGVIGLNGSGKSTIFEAVAWALYGTVAARTSSEDIRRDTAEPSSICLVDLVFQFEGDEYRVVRQMKGKNLVSSATITRNGQISATGAGPSTSYIQNILGIDYKSFFTSIYAKQKELNTLSSMNASERRPLILKMLGIDALDDVIKQINMEKRTKTSLINHLEKNIYDAQGKEKETLFVKQEKDYQKQLKQTKKELKEMKETLQHIKKDYKSKQEIIKQAKKTYETINKQYETLIKQKTIFEQQKQVTSDITTLEKKIKLRTETIQHLTEKLEQYSNTHKEITQIENRIKNLTTSSHDLIKKQTQHQVSLHQLSTQHKELIKKQKTIQKLGKDAACPTCERELGNQYHFLLEKYGTKEQINNEEQLKLKKTDESIQKQQERIKRELQALQKKKEYYLKKEKEQQTLAVKLESQQQEKSMQQKELHKKKTALKKLPQIDFNSETFQLVQKKRTQQYQTYQQQIKKANTKKDMLTKQSIKMEKKQSDLALIQQKILSLTKQKEDIKKIKETITNEQKNLQETTLLKDVMTEFRLHLISRIRPALSYHASQFYQELTDGKYPEIHLDEHYNMSIYDNGDEYPIERFSGGEIDLANLCLRLAISDVITERAQGLFHFIILDEIFGSQDQIRQQNIMQQLYKLSSTFKQIFLITHVESVKHYMQHILNVEEIDAESKITIQ